MDADLEAVVDRALDEALAACARDLEPDLTVWRDERGALHVSSGAGTERGWTARARCRDETFDDAGGLVDAFVLDVDHRDGRGAVVVVPYTFDGAGAPRLGERLVRPRRTPPGQSPTSRT